MLTFWVRLIFMADKFSRKAWSGSAHHWIKAPSGRSRRWSRTAGSALVTKDQHLSHGSGSQEKMNGFHLRVRYCGLPPLWSQVLDPSADVPPRHGPSSRGCKLSREATVLRLNSEVGGRTKVRVMVRLGWWWGQTVHPPLRAAFKWPPPRPGVVTQTAFLRASHILNYSSSTNEQTRQEMCVCG